MNESTSPEYGTGRGGDQRLPSGQPRPLTARERARIERTAAIRDVPLAEVERETRVPPRPEKLQE